MNDMNVPNSTAQLDALRDALDDLSPQARKAATYLLEHPSEAGLKSVRALAAAAGVKPNTLVRLAQALGHEGFEDFRAPFRADLTRAEAFTDRARWLQSLDDQGDLGGLFASMAEAAISNIERTFAATSAEDLRAAAQTIVAARHTFVLGVGVNNTNARNFAYLADMASYNIWAIPRPGGVASDDLSRAGPRDVVIAMTCKPYRSEVVAAAQLAVDQGATLIGISDSLASPVFTRAAHRFLVAAETPQFFPSSVAILALLETLMSFVIAAAPREAVTQIEEFHARRHALGLYVEEGR